jgi:hypothetical protein
LTCDFFSVLNYKLKRKLSHVRKVLISVHGTDRGWRDVKKKRKRMKTTREESPQPQPNEEENPQPQHNEGRKTQATT